MELEQGIEAVCLELAAIMNNPISSDPERVWSLYKELGNHWRELSLVVGIETADIITTNIYRQIVKPV